MKKVIIIHCWEGYPNYCWYPWVKKALEEKNYEVIVPEMPETNFPKISQWLPKLKETVGKPSEDIYLIGHSLGCITILRYLESLKENEKIGGAIFVAGFTDNLGYNEIKNFFESPINFERIKLHCPKFVAIHSDNDPYVPLRYGNIFKEKLNAKLVIKHNMGHFSGEIGKEESCTKLPDVIKNLLEMTNEYHGNLLDTEFRDPNFLKRFKIFAKKKSEKNPWTMHGVIIPADKIESVIKEVQENLLSNAPYYAHFYRDNEIILVFKEKVFRITPDKSTWKEAIEYGRSLGIPDEQLVFAPNKFENEEKYYGKENFL
jgi:hypothetical protein